VLLTHRGQVARSDGFDGAFVAAQLAPATNMKIIFLCILMTSILLASFYGPPVPALRRLLLNR
jgi:hypothetical protein